MGSVPWKWLELAVLRLFALVFYLVVIRRSPRLSHDYSGRLYGLRAGSLAGRLNDLSDPQWRNFRRNLPVLTAVMCAFLILVTRLRYCYSLKGRGASLLWLLLSWSYLCYLHGACVGFILIIAWINYSIVKTTIVVHFDGTYASILMTSFGCDYCRTFRSSHFDRKKHMQRCQVCYSGKTCNFALQERGLSADKYTFLTYLCYLTYAPLYIAGPIVSYNAFAAQVFVEGDMYERE